MLSIETLIRSREIKYIWNDSNWESYSLEDYPYWMGIPLFGDK